MLTLCQIHFILEEATGAANEEGLKWIKSHQFPQYIVRDGFTKEPIGTMLDLCGNAHVIIKDKRSSTYKAFKKHGFIYDYGRFAVLEINHNYKARQEHGLQLACANAAKQSLIANGIFNVEIWDYID